MCSLSKCPPSHAVLGMLFSVLFTSACGPAQTVDDRKVVLRAAAGSNDSYKFELSNGGDREVSFRGWNQNVGESEVAPLYSAGCIGDAKSSSAPDIFVGPRDLPITAQRTITLSPSKSLTLNVPKSDFAGQAGARCFITLLIENIGPVNSDEFSP
jgi:hypothetical protein